VLWAIADPATCHVRGFGAIQEVDGSVNSDYNSLYVNFRQRFAHGLTFMQGYTWSRSIDNGSAIRAHGGDVLLPQDNNNLRGDRGLSNLSPALKRRSERESSELLRRS